MTDLQHLELKASDEVLREFFADRFVEHPSATAIMEEMRFIYETGALKRRPYNLMVVGDSGAGKTALLEEFVRRYAKVDLAEGIVSQVRTIAITEMPVNPSEGTLLSAISEAGGLGPMDKPNLGRFVTGADRSGLRLIIIDEFHNLDAATRNHKLACLNLLKWLGNQTGLSLIIAGTQNISRIMSYDEQFEKRFRALKLPNWRSNRHLERFVYSYLASLPIETPKSLPRRLFVALLKGPSPRTVDIAFTLSQAAYEAQRSGDPGRLTEIVEEIIGRSGYVS